jgi:hypothetical protein
VFSLFLIPSEITVISRMIRYIGPEEFVTFWNHKDFDLKPIVEEAAKEG